MFKTVQDDANNVFVSLPPPTRSIQEEKRHMAAYAGGPQAAAALLALALLDLSGFCLLCSAFVRFSWLE